MTFFSLHSVGVVIGATTLIACSGDGGGAGANGTGGMSGSEGGASGASGASTNGGAGPTGTGGAPANIGSGGIMPIGSGGSMPVTGGAPPIGGTSSGGTSGGAPSGTGGKAAASGGSTGAAGAPPTNCMSMSPVGPTIFGMFPTADPSKKGSLAVTTQNNVGPNNSFTLFRPTDMTKNGPLFPVVTWGNGTGTMPTTYSFLLTALASHGFIVIASNSQNVGQGTPPPMLDGVTWVFQQNCDSSSPLYQHVDTAHVGATGHSQGAFATMSAGTDPRIVATAPIEGARAAKLNGPSLLLCGTKDTTVGCMGAQSAFTSITQPVMYGELLAADHTNWIAASFGGGAPSPFVTAVVAWMRVFLMGDTSLKPMFYGADCTMCKDTATWKVQQKMLN
jgi:hypothetical protein